MPMPLPLHGLPLRIGTFVHCKTVHIVFGTLAICTVNAHRSIINAHAQSARLPCHCSLSDLRRNIDFVCWPFQPVKQCMCPTPLPLAGVA